MIWEYPYKDESFNPRSPWGERPTGAVHIREIMSVSIHAPRGGSDRMANWYQRINNVSIHAPRGGSDALTL